MGLQGLAFRGKDGVHGPLTIEKILSHLGLAPQPPPKGRVREAGLHFAA